MKIGDCIQYLVYWNINSRIAMAKISVCERLNVEKKCLFVV